MKDLVELGKALVEKVDNDVIITHYKSGTEISEEDAREIDGAYVTMSQGDDMFVILDLSAGGTKIARTAETFFAKRGRMIPYIKAVAVVKEHNGSFLSRFLAKKSIYPQKEFRNTDQAKAWFNTLRN